MKLNNSSDAAACKLLLRLLCSLFICKSSRAAGCTQIGIGSSISKLKSTASLQTDPVLSEVGCAYPLSCESTLHHSHIELWVGQGQGRGVTVLVKTMRWLHMSTRCSSRLHDKRNLLATRSGQDRGLTALGDEFGEDDAMAAISNASGGSMTATLCNWRGEAGALNSPS